LLSLRKAPAGASLFFSYEILQTPDFGGEKKAVGYDKMLNRQARRRLRHALPH